MIVASNENVLGKDVQVLGPYRPWGYHKEHGGDFGSYPDHSGKILDVKERRARGLSYFAEYIGPRIKLAKVIAIVPSHDPAKGPGGLHALAQTLSAQSGAADASGVLVRHTKIAKLADGGCRDMQVHLDSIHIPAPHQIRGKTVLLIDDVMTTGNSMIACERLLREAGAAKVTCLALGRTTY